MDEVEEPLHEVHSGDDRDSKPPDDDQPEKSLPIPRRAALLIAAGVVVLLALGWAVDSLGTFAPAVHFTNGETQQAGLYRVALTLNPAVQRAGQPEHFSLAVTDLTGRAASGLKAQLDLTMVTMEMPEITVPATAAGNGTYTATATTSMPGEWHLDVTLTPASGASVHTQFDIAAT